MVRTVLIATVLVLSVSSVDAADKKPPQLRDFPFWTGPKTPHARAFIPGLQAALQISEDQAAKIEAACQDTIDKPEAKGKNASPEYQDKLHEMVAKILTDNQKKLIEKMNDAYANTIREAGEEFQPQLVAAKGNAEETAKLRKAQQDAIVEIYQKKIVAVLSNEQWELVKKAAEIERKRNEENSKKVKPNK